MRVTAARQVGYFAPLIKESKDRKSLEQSEISQQTGKYGGCTCLCVSVGIYMKGE